MRNTRTFATRDELKAIGLSAKDIEGFQDLRTRKGWLSIEDFQRPVDGISSNGGRVLEDFFNDGDASASVLPRLALDLFAIAPVRDRRPGLLSIFYHSAIDQVYCEFTREITLRGPSDINIFDISLAHVIEIEIKDADGELLDKRFAAPRSLRMPDGGGLRMIGGDWMLEPTLHRAESWDTTGEELFVRLFFRPGGTDVSLPLEVPAPPKFLRNGRFQVMGQPEFRFDTYTLAMAFPADTLFTELSTIFESMEAPSFRRFKAIDPILSEVRKRLSLEPGSIDFEGRFELGPVERPGLASRGWVWMLSGPDILVGYEPDENLYEPRTEMVIIIPGDNLESESKTIPFNVSEQSLLARPEMFGSDPGAQCRPFDNPSRILGERRFYTSLRVTQPYVEGAGRDTILPEDETGRPLHYPRSEANEQREIEYESDRPGLYSAKTVALGHVIESAVRYRSNGYSLGDISYSLTLAPRQKRKIVKLDWTRAEKSKREEDLEAEESVADSTNRTRSYENAVSAELNEWASGRSNSNAASASLGFGFAVPGFVGGGGASASTASSSSSQAGGRTTAARESQQLNDAIRRWGDSTRNMRSTVIQETEQSEEVEGVSEVIQNINYTRSLSVIYYEILRHLRIDTEIAGVSECIYVPMPIRPFTDDRIRMHQHVLRRYARGYWERIAFRYLDFLPSNLSRSDLPANTRASQPLNSLSGSVYITMGISIPGEKEYAEKAAASEKPLKTEQVAAIFQKAFSPFVGFAGIPLIKLSTKQFVESASARNRFFQREVAPDMARKYMDALKLTVDTVDLRADFTLASSYRFGQSLRVDFTADIEGLGISRDDLRRVKLSFAGKFLPDETGDAPDHKLPSGTYMNATFAQLTYSNDHYEGNAASNRGTRDLLIGTTGEADPEGAILEFRLNHADKRNIRKMVSDAYAAFKKRLEQRTHFFHKVIWWNMDRDELFTLLDGYAISATDGRSLASVCQSRPSGIVGNSLVFRTNTDSPLDPQFDSFDDLKNHYLAGLKPTDPMRISLPTEGVYARAHLDGCVAAEEHNGSFDWVFDNQEPELADLPSSMFDSRRVEPQNMTPSQMPTSIINLQNVPEAPGVSGFDGVLGAVQNGGAFRDMAGLSGTQQNMRAAMQASANLANSFGNMALQNRLAELESDAKAGTDTKAFLDSLNKAHKDGTLSKEQAQASAAKFADRKAAGGGNAKEEEHRRNMEREALGGPGGGSVKTTDKDGSSRDIKKNPSPKSDEKPKPKPHKGYVKWLNGPEGAKYLLLYNFKTGDENPTLHPDHKRAIEAVSVQIAGTDDIDVLEGRASKTVVKGASKEASAAKNKDLSIARMSLVWDALMEYAFDPQSNIDKQQYKSNIHPIREDFGSQLKDIPENGGEDPAERSVLIKLTRKVDPKIKPEKKPTPNDWPDIYIFGHVMQILINKVKHNVFYKNNNWHISKSQDNSDNSSNSTIINNGDTYNNTKFSFFEGGINITVDNSKTIYNSPNPDKDNPGELDVNQDSKPTKQWKIDITDPDKKGQNIREYLDQLKKIFEAARDITDEVSSSLTFTWGGEEFSFAPTETLKTVAAVMNDVQEMILFEGSPLEKTLLGLVQGNVSVNVEISAMYEGEGFETPSKKFTLSGRGIYYGRDLEGGNVTNTIKRFDYETSEPIPLSAWGSLKGIDEIGLKYARSAVLEDFGDLMGFLGKLTNFLSPITPASEMLQKVETFTGKLNSVIPGADFFAGKEEIFVFTPLKETENPVKSDEIDAARSVTMFTMKKGILRSQ